MSELMNTRNANLRWRLLTTASALVFLNANYAALAADSDADRPTVWIELGGQFEKQTGSGDPYIPSFAARNPSAPAFQGFSFNPRLGANFSNGINGNLTFEPSDSDWVFSASVRYGRTNQSRNPSHITPGHELHNKFIFATYTKTPSGFQTKTNIHCCVTLDHIGTLHAYANMQSRAEQSNAILDFQAGRDVGLGLFGGRTTSVVSAGVRFAQFTSKSDVSIHASPNVVFKKHILHRGHPTPSGYAKYTFSGYRASQHRYQANITNRHQFRGIGPEISWNSTMPILGNPQAGEVDFGWGVNAAVLFGKQRVSGSHSTDGEAHYYYTTNTYHHSGSFDRKRNIVVPNLGGTASLSLRYANAKLTLGYRGDFFFGAMDAGNDARKTETVGFYGPFATISIGLGG